MSYRRRPLVGLILVVASLLSTVPAFASPPSNAIRYVHDADGRLKAVIEPEGENALYSWDSAGNLLSISRHSSATLSIIQLASTKAAIGETVTIDGTGFSTTPASDTVKFNGTSATVSAATALSLTVKVPVGATTGTVTVKTPGEGPVTSAQTFTVVESTTPTITSLSGSVAAAGEEITISGSHFESAASGNVVTLNRSRPEVTSTSTSSIKFKVPSATLGGHVSVSTTNGSSTGPDLFIPPNEMATSKVGTTGRFSLNESKSVSFAGSEKVAVMLFDGTAGQRASIVLSESTIEAGTASIWGPSGSELSSGVFSKSEGGMVDGTTLPSTGTYTLLLEPSGPSSGSVKVTSYGFQDVTGSISPESTAEGTSQPVSISTPGRNARYSVKMTTGEKVSLKTTSSAFSGSYSISWLNSKGETLYSEYWNPTENSYWNPKTFESAGTYTLLVDPAGTTTGSVTLKLWKDPDITGQTLTPSAEGATKTSTISVPGQRELISFSGSKEQKVSLVPSESTFSGGSLSILTPKGTELSGSGGGFTEIHEPSTLPEAGTYSIVVDPENDNTGTLKVTAYKVEDLTGSISPAATAEGTSQSVSLPTPGQVARYSVTMTAGEKVSLKTTSSAFSGYYYISWLNSKGETLFSEYWNSTENRYWEPKTFASAGTDTLLVDPEGTNTGSVTLKLWKDPDVTGQTITPSTGGATKTSTISVPGERELITFSGSKEQKVSLVPSESTFTSGSLSILTPEGTELSGSSSGFSEIDGPVTLPEAGTYSIVIDPENDSTGSVQLTAYTAKDLTGSISPAATAEGTSQSVSLPTPGQVARYSVTMTAGEKVSLKTTSSAFSGYYYISWLNSKGETLFSEYWNSTENRYWNPKTFASAGTYTLLVDPEGTNTGSVTLKLWKDPDITGQTITPSTGGATKTSTISVPGERELITFSGTKGQKISLVPSENKMSEGSLSILTPKGTELSGSGGGFSEIHGPSTLPETGTYSIVVDPENDNTGTLKVTAYKVEDLTGSISPAATAEGTSQSVSLPTPGQVARYSVTMTAGEKVSLKTTSSAFSGYYYISWLNSKGETLFSEYWNSTENRYWEPKTFASAGTDTLLVDPEGTNTGSVTLKLWKDPDVTGQTITPSTGGATKTSTISVPGERELISFSGTSGKVLTFKTSESSITGGTMSILKPAGAELAESARSFSSGSNARAEVTLPETGTYKVVIDPEIDYTGSVKVIGYLGSHAAWYGPIQGTTEFADLMIPSPSGPEGNSGAAGPQSVMADFPSGSSRSHTNPSNPRDARRVHPALANKHNRPDSSPAHRAKAAVSRHVHHAPQSSHKAQSKAPSHVGPPSKAHAGLRPDKGSGITAKMRAFHPAAIKVWHPTRSRRGIRGWEAAEPQSPWTQVAQLQAPAGTTALAGQALGLNGLPLAGVRLSLEGSSLSAETDREGRFLLAGVPAGHQVFVIDGESVPGDRRYGSYEAGVDLADHKTTTLDYKIWLTPLDRAGDRRIDSPTKRETNLRTPSVPGLEVRIPAGTVIRNAAGRTVKNLNISAVPVNQTPFPLPPFVPIPVYFTVQPGRAYLSKGAQIVYPNWAHLPPGQRAEFWNYDAKDRGWYVYGRGTVTADGKQVVPDPGVRVWQFTGAMLATSPLPPGSFPTGTSSGDPVDLHSGLFTYNKTDLVLPDNIPIVIQRTYRQSDSNSYSFGTGTTSLYDMRLWSGHAFSEADLIMPDGQRIHYVRTSEGTGYGDAKFESTSTPGKFYASTITYHPAGGGAYWDLKLTDGTTYVFGVGQLLAIRDSHGNTLTITRSGSSITQITSPHGRWVKFSYDASNRITEITDNGGQHLNYAYTEGLLTSATDAAGRKTEYEYNGSGQMTSVTDARGNKYLETDYDASGRVEKQTTGDGATFEFAYDLNEGGEVEAATVTDPRGSQREVAFNAQGLPTSETLEPGTKYEQTTSFERQAETGLLLSSSDPLGRKTTFEYDSSGNVKELIKLAGTGEAQTFKDAYEPGTNRITENTDPLGHTTKYEYGAQGELLKETDPLGHETSFEYDGEGQLSSTTNPEGEQTKLSYDHGDLASVTDPLGRTTSQFVDGLGRVTAITSPGGQRTSYAYNEDSQITSLTSPSGAKTSVEYDADGDPTAIVDPRGNETTRAYDVMDRLESETDALGKTAEWSYDKAGDLEETKDRNGSIATFAYDPLRRLTSASYGVSGKSAESSIDYEYDGANRLKNVKDSASGEYQIGYDELDRLTEMKAPSGTISYAYDAANRREAMSVPGQEPLLYTFDKANRLIELARGGQTVSLGYDKANRPESLTLPDGIKQSYGYDKAGEPTSIAYKKGESTLGELDYAYNPNGQVEAMWGSYARTGLPEALSSTEYNADNELNKSEGKTLTYDKDGNLTSNGSSEYTWNARGQLTGISGASTGSFGYDPFGRRIAKTLGASTTKMLYDGPNVVQESVGESVTGNLITGPQPDQIYSRARSGGTDSYLTNPLNSTIALANSSGEVKTSYTYDPFGTTTSTGAESGNPYQFTGRENDGTGLQYNRARYYSPSGARFISQDPAGFAGSGANLYWYANGDPLDFTDPTGRCIVVCVPDPIDTAGELASGAANNIQESANQVGSWVSGAPGVISTAAHVSLNFFAVPPYALYYFSHQAAKGINSAGSYFGVPGEIASHIAGVPLVPAQVSGLAGDAGIDWIKGHTVTHESVDDEGLGSEVYLNPVHKWIPGGPAIRNAPGIGPGGNIDIEW